MALAAAASDAWLCEGRCHSAYGAVRRIPSPPISRRSTLTTSAPISASSCPHVGPAITCVLPDRQACSQRSLSVGQAQRGSLMHAARARQTHSSTTLIPASTPAPGSPWVLNDRAAGAPASRTTAGRIILGQKPRRARRRSQRIGRSLKDILIILQVHCT